MVSNLFLSSFSRKTCINIMKCIQIYIQNWISITKILHSMCDKSRRLIALHKDETFLLIFWYKDFSEIFPWIKNMPDRSSQKKLSSLRFPRYTKTMLILEGCSRYIVRFIIPRRDLLYENIIHFIPKQILTYIYQSLVNGYDMSFGLDYKMGNIV